LFLLAVGARQLLWPLESDEAALGLVEEAEKRRQDLEDKVARFACFQRELERIQRDLIDEELPLRTAVERILLSAERNYPAYLLGLGAPFLEPAFLEADPTMAHKLAAVLVQAHRSLPDLPAGVLERLESELRIMNDTAGFPDPFAQMCF
jgi:hypothetical protein